MKYLKVKPSTSTYCWQEIWDTRQSGLIRPELVMKKADPPPSKSLVWWCQTSCICALMTIMRHCNNRKRDWLLILAAKCLIAKCLVLLHCCHIWMRCSRHFSASEVMLFQSVSRSLLLPVQRRPPYCNVRLILLHTVRCPFFVCVFCFCLLHWFLKRSVPSDGPHSPLLNLASCCVWHSKGILFLFSKIKRFRPLFNHVGKDKKNDSSTPCFRHWQQVGNRVICFCLG